MKLTEDWHQPPPETNILLYKIIRCDGDRMQLTETVQEQINNGWTPLGGPLWIQDLTVTVTDVNGVAVKTVGHYEQALAFYSNPKDDPTF